MDGYEVASRLRREVHRPLVIIAITGHDREPVRRRALAAGCDHFFIKPFKPRDLLTLLSRSATLRADSPLPRAAVRPSRRREGRPSPGSSTGRRREHPRPPPPGRRKLVRLAREFRADVWVSRDGRKASGRSILDLGDARPAGTVPGSTWRPTGPTPRRPGRPGRAQRTRVRSATAMTPGGLLFTPSDRMATSEESSNKSMRDKNMIRTWDSHVPSGRRPPGACRPPGPDRASSLGLSPRSYRPRYVEERLRRSEASFWPSPSNSHTSAAGTGT